MPRRRSTPGGNQQGTSTAATQPTTNTKQGERKIMGLTPEQIKELMGQGRQKGQYTRRLTEFIASGVGAVCVSEEWPEFAGADKKAATVKQGFENAKNSKNAPAGADEVKVQKNEELVYLINYASAEVREAQAA